MAASPAKKNVGRSRLVDFLDHHMNPVLVKDIRAWLHSKKFLFVFFICLLLIMGTTFVFTITPETGGGEPLFIILAAGLGFVLVGILPFLMHDRFTEELASGSTELALISRMTPGQLVRGKIMSGVAASLLFFSAATPSFTIAYMIGGVNLLALIYSMLLLIFLSVIAMIAAILLVAITGKRKLKILGVLLILGGFQSTGMLVGLAALFREESIGLSLEFLFANVVGLAYVSLFAIFFYTVAVSRLSFEADNRDARPRMALSALGILPVIVTAAFLVLADIFGSGVKDADEVMAVVVALSLGMFLFCLLFVLSTPDRISGRIRSRASRIPPIRLLLYPGQGRLYAFILLHLGFFAAASLLPAYWRFDEEVTATLFAAAALVSPAMLGVCTLLHFGFTRIPWFRVRKVPRGLVTGLILFLWALAFAPLAAVVEGADIEEAIMGIHPLGTLVILGDDASVEHVAIAIVVNGLHMTLPMLFWIWKIIAAGIEDFQIFIRRKPAAPAPETVPAVRESVPSASRSIPPAVAASIPPPEVDVDGTQTGDDPGEDPDG